MPQMLELVSIEIDETDETEHLEMIQQAELDDAVEEIVYGEIDETDEDDEREMIDQEDLDDTLDVVYIEIDENDETDEVVIIVELELQEDDEALYDDNIDQYLPQRVYTIIVLYDAEVTDDSDELDVIKHNDETDDIEQIYTYYTEMIFIAEKYVIELDADENDDEVLD